MNRSNFFHNPKKGEWIDWRKARKVEETANRPGWLAEKRSQAGLKQLPTIPRSELEAEFASLAPTNGKKAPVPVERVRQMSKF
ncbi:MAG: hypothetical protein MUD14_26330 [Hydrococcus sp. Prado102]|nr:hypothetical protein [Hydrococcus sp. Prado102]